MDSRTAGPPRGRDAVVESGSGRAFRRPTCPALAGRVPGLVAAAAASGPTPRRAPRGAACRADGEAPEPTHRLLGVGRTARVRPRGQRTRGPEWPDPARRP